MTLTFKAAACTLAVAAAALAACGGGTAQYEAFVPLRVLSFGDEASALTADGHNYAVNGLDANNAFDCNVQPNWVQSFAGSYGFVYAECNTAAATPRATTRAAAGAKVAEVVAQVDAQIAAGGFRDKDLVTFFVGTNDVIELYTQYPARDAASLLAEARVRGEQAAQQVNRIVGFGAKVVVANLPDMGLTPYAATQRAANGDIDRAALISRLSLAFNEQLGVKILLDGRFIGLVQLDQRTQVIGRSPSSFGFANVTSAVCSAPLPSCTTATLVAEGNAGTWLWADDRWFASGGHTQFASLAIDRARRNPF